MYPYHVILHTYPDTTPITLLKGLLEINEEVECVVKADGDVIGVTNCPESSKHKECEEGETHARDAKEG